MSPSSLVRWPALVVLGASLVVGAGACGPRPGPPPKVVVVQPGEMPAGGDWEGVYFSQVYGYLHILRKDEKVQGRWRTTSGDAWGKLEGVVDGNLLQFTWREQKVGQVGPQSVKTGKGFFHYVEPKAGEAHELQGQWGLGESNAGNPWTAVKQKDRKPDFASVVPDEYETTGQGGGWE